MILLALLVAFDVAITVDDLPAHGPQPPGYSRVEIVQKLIAGFRKHHLPPVYGFVNGSKAADNPGVLELWKSAGNPLGNHGLRHLSLTDTAPSEYLADIAANEPFITAKVYRYPFLYEGETLEKRDAVRAWLAGHGYRIAQVTIDGDDWAWNGPFGRCAQQGDLITLGRLRRTFLDAQVRSLAHYREYAQKLLGREPAHVFLMHAGAMDADQIDALLSSFEAAGARFVTLDRALEDPLYALDPRLATKAGSTLLDKLGASRKVGLPWTWPDEDWLAKACQ